MVCGRTNGEADDMTFTTDRHVKNARKPHRCVWCGNTITVGEPYLRRSGRVYEYDGFFSMAAHEICDGIVSALVDDYEWDYEYIEEGVLSRGVLAHIDSAEVDYERGYRRCQIVADPDVYFDSIDGVIHPSGWADVHNECPRCGRRPRMTPHSRSNR